MNIDILKSNITRETKRDSQNRLVTIGSKVVYPTWHGMNEGIIVKFTPVLTELNNGFKIKIEQSYCLDYLLSEEEKMNNFKIAENIINNAKEKAIKDKAEKITERFLFAIWKDQDNSGIVYIPIKSQPGKVISQKDFKENIEEFKITNSDKQILLPTIAGSITPETLNYKQHFLFATCNCYNRDASYYNSGKYSDYKSYKHTPFIKFYQNDVKKESMWFSGKCKTRIKYLVTYSESSSQNNNINMYIHLNSLPSFFNEPFKQQELEENIAKITGARLYHA